MSGDGNARLIFSAEDQTAAVFKALNANLGQLHTLGEKVKGTLEALGVTLSAGYFIDMVKGSIEAANHLGDLSKSTDITVEQLAGLKLLAQQSGTDLDGLAKGINRMTVEIGKAPDKFRELGVTAKDGVGALKQVADIFQQLPDITQRNAVANAIFSKSWAEMAPILADGGAHIEETIAKGERLSGMTADLARQANEFNGKLAELTGTNGLLNRELGPLLPLLNELADEIITARDKTADADHEFDALAETLKAIVITGGNVAFTFRGIGREIGGLYAEISALGIDLPSLMQGPAGIARALGAAVVSGEASATRFKAIHEEMRADAEKDRAEFDAWQAKIMGVSATMGTVADASDAMSRRMQSASRADQAAASARAAAFLAWQDASKKAEAEYDALIKRIDEKKQADTQELATGRALTDFEKFEAKIVADLNTNKSVLNATQKAAVLGHLAETKALSDLLNVQKAMLANNANYAKDWAKSEEDMATDAVNRAAARDAEVKTLNDQTKALQESNAQQQLEATLVGATAAQRDTALGQLRVQQQLERDLLALDQNLMLNEEQRAKFRAQLYDNAAVEKALVADRAALDQFTRGWDAVDQEAQAVWNSMEQGGDATFKHLEQTLKQTLWDLLYQMTLKQWVFQIYANVTGGPAGLAAASNAIGAGGSSIAGSLAGSALGGSSMLGAGFSATMSNGLISGFGANMANIGTLIDAGSYMTALSAAAPYLAIGALVVGSLLKSGGGPKVDGQFNPFTHDTMGVGNSADQSQSGIAATAAQALQTQYNALISQLGGKGGMQFGVGLSTDPKGTAPSMVQIDAGAGGVRQFESVNLNVGRSDQELQAAIAAQSVDVLIQALRASNLDKPFQDFFNGIADDASQQTKQAAFKVAGDVASYTAQIRNLGGVFDQLTNLSVQTRGALIDAAGGLQALTQATNSYYDNFYTDSEKRQIVAKNISATLTAAGLDVTADQVLGATRAQFRSLVDSLDLTTDSGRSSYVALMSVAGAFAGITQPIQDATTALDGMSQSATQFALDSAHKAYDDALKANLKTITDAATRYRDFSQSLRQFMNQLTLGDLSPLTPGERYAQAKQQFESIYAQAQTGDQNAMSQLQGAASDFLKASQTYNASSPQYTADFQEVQQMLAQGISQADQAAAWAEAQQAIMNAQLSSLEGIAQNTLDLKSAFDQFAAAVTAALAAGQNPGAANLAALTGGITGSFVTTPVGAVYASAGGAAALNGTIYTIGGQTYSYDQARSYIGGLVNSGHSLDAYYAVKSAGMTLADVDRLMQWAPDTAEQMARGAGLPVFHGGTDSVPRTGLALVQQGERIIPTGHNIAGDATVVLRLVLNELQRLRAQHADGTRAIVAAAYDSASQAATQAADRASKAAARQAFQQQNARAAGRAGVAA